MHTRRTPPLPPRRVHEHNVDALMAAALPYHETPQFVRLVQALRLQPRSLWAFLEPMQGSGAPAPRETLVLRCLTDRVRCCRILRLTRWLRSDGS